jgi:hypothetical protein
MGEAIFFSSHKDMSRDKVTYHSFLIFFFHPAASEPVLPNNFFFQNSLTLFRKLLIKLFSKKTKTAS